MSEIGLFEGFSSNMIEEFAKESQKRFDIAAQQNFITSKRILFVPDGKNLATEIEAGPLKDSTCLLHYREESFWSSNVNNASSRIPFFQRQGKLLISLFATNNYTQISQLARGKGDLTVIIAHLASGSSVKGDDLQIREQIIFSQAEIKGISDVGDYLILPIMFNIKKIMTTVLKPDGTKKGNTADEFNTLTNQSK